MSEKQRWKDFRMTEKKLANGFRMGKKLASRKRIAAIRQVITEFMLMKGNKNVYTFARVSNRTIKLYISTCEFEAMFNCPADDSTYIMPLVEVDDMTDASQALLAFSDSCMKKIGICFPDVGYGYTRVYVVAEGRVREVDFLGLHWSITQCIGTHAFYKCGFLRYKFQIIV